MVMCPTPLHNGIIYTNLVLCHFSLSPSLPLSIFLYKFIEILNGWRQWRIWCWKKIHNMSSCLGIAFEIAECLHYQSKNKYVYHWNFFLFYTVR